MINSYYTSVHSQHNESLICANIHYICISVYYGRSATINTVVGTNSVFLLVGSLGTNCFRLIPVTTWGSGEGVVHEYSLERGWGHDVGRGQRGSQVGNYFLGNPKVFPRWIPLPRETEKQKK